jgi:hypothetical protein
LKYSTTLGRFANGNRKFAWYSHKQPESNSVAVRGWIRFPAGCVDELRLLVAQASGL